MKVLVSEKLSEHKYKTPEGYLICTDAILARTGKQTYTKDEVFGDGDSTEIDVDRPYDQVMNPKTIASFENKPITFDHPSEDVNVGNYKDYAIGYVRDVHQGKTDKGEDVILGNLVITDQDAINAIEQGDHTDLSCGYDCDIKDDNKGAYMQTNIRGNHVALCEQGRAGIARIVDSNIVDGHNVRTVEWIDNDVYVEYDADERKYYLASDNDRYGWRNFDSVGQAIAFYKYNKSDVRNSILDSIKDSKVKDFVKDANSYLVISKRYKPEAIKQGFNVEDGGSMIRVWGPRWKLERWQEQYDMDEEISYAKIKDSDSSISIIFNKLYNSDYDSFDEVKRDFDRLKSSLSDTEKEKIYKAIAFASGMTISSVKQRLGDSKQTKFIDDGYTYKLTKKKNDYDEYVVQAYKNGKKYEDATYYTDDWDDAINTLKSIAKQEKLTFRQQGSVFIADNKAKVFNDSKEIGIDEDEIGIEDSKIKDKFYTLSTKWDDRQDFARIAKMYNLKAYSNDTVEGSINNIEEFIHNYCKESFDRDRLYDSKIKDAIPDSLKEALRKLGKSFEDLKDDNIYNRVREYIENKYGEKEFDKVYDYLENYINKHSSYEDSYENDYSKEMTMSDALKILNIVESVKARDEYLGMVYINGRPMYVIHKKEPGIPEFWGITPSKWSDNPKKKFKSKKELDEYLTSVNAVSN